MTLCWYESCVAYSNVSDVIDLFTNISWSIVANNEIVEKDTSNWITYGRYREYVINVIGQTVADCVTTKNEFTNKQERDVITYKSKLEYCSTKKLHS